MERGSGSTRPHLPVPLLLVGALVGLFLHVPVPSVPTPLPQGEMGGCIATAFPVELSPLCRVFVESGIVLMGRVDYFWNGKSDAVGWDARWSVPVVVIAPGNSSSGEGLPSGLDCSSFVSWCAVNVAGDPAAFTAVGNGVRAQRALCAPVDWADALPGDLAFYPDPSHMEIVVGRGEDGGLLVPHYSYSLGGVVYPSDAKATGFTDLGRPLLLEKML